MPFHFGAVLLSQFWGRENRDRGVTAEMKARKFLVNAGGTAEYSPCVLFQHAGRLFLYAATITIIQNLKN